MPVKKFSGPIEEIIGNTCPGAPYCSADKCFRTGGTCGDNGNCCLDREGVNSVVKSLGCDGGGTFTSSRRFSSLAGDPIAIGKCTTELNLSDSDVSFLCKDSSKDDCFSKLCGLGCSSINCDKPPVTINLKNSICQTVQQYCDILDPSLLTDPNLNKLCCGIDPISGIKDRTVCGCPDNPCKTNPVQTNNINALKTMASQFWKDNSNNNIVQPPIITPSSPVFFNLFDSKNYILLILFIFLIIGISLYFYFKEDTSGIYITPLSDI